MNLLTLLFRHLPESGSPKGDINSLDLMKALRTGIIVLVSVFVYTFGQAVLQACNVVSADVQVITNSFPCYRAMDWGVLLLSAAQAAGAAAVSAAGELFRRWQSR